MPNAELSWKKGTEMEMSSLVISKAQNQHTIEQVIFCGR